MKLIRLYIENFGGLSRYALDFEAGITTVTEPNGFGKTTLAEFIRAMLYGFPRKTKTLEKSLRQKYTPWNGGLFGGNLVFEHLGQRYRVERTFGAIPREDTFLVIDLATNKRTSRFPEDLGQALFGLDGDSFERSTYLPQSREDGPIATASIHAKLTQLIEDSDEIADFDKAMAALRAKRSALVPYRGNGGSVAETAAEITRLQLQLDDVIRQEAQLEAAQDEAARLQKTLETRKNRLDQICEELTAATQQLADVRCRQDYEQLCGRHRKTAERIAQYRKKYPRGLPWEEELRPVETAADSLLRREETGENPSVDQLERCRGLCRDYEQIQEQLYEQHRCAAELAQEKHQQPAAKMIIAVLLWVLAAAGLLAGAILARLQHALALPVLGTGGITFAAGVILLCLRGKEQRRRKQERKRRQSELDHRIEALSRAAGNCRAEITAIFAMYRITAQPQQYAAALAQLEQRSASAVRQHEATEIVQTFLRELGVPPEQDVQTALRILREDIRAVQAAEAFLKELEAQIREMETTHGDILYAEFRSVMDPALLRTEEQQLRAALTEDASRMLQLRQKIQSLQARLSELPQLREALASGRQKLEQQRENVRLLDATMEFLQQSRENLSTAYLGTIQSRFGHYLSQLHGLSVENYLIGTDMEVQLERNGKVRELAYFSAGQTDLIMLCMRLALVDSMFKEQEIFVILDDPFVNLDDAHMAQARELLGKLAAQRQILYLTCHSSRNI